MALSVLLKNPWDDIELRICLVTYWGCKSGEGKNSGVVSTMPYDLTTTALYEIQRLVKSVAVQPYNDRSNLQQLIWLWLIELI